MYTLYTERPKLYDNKYRNMFILACLIQTINVETADPMEPKINVEIADPMEINICLATPGKVYGWLKLNNCPNLNRKFRNNMRSIKMVQS